MPDSTPSIPIARLTPADLTEQDEAAAVLAECFTPENDPISRCVYRGIPDLDNFNALRFKSRVYASVRDLQVTVARSCGVGAVMVVNPPGTMDHTPEPTPYSDALAARITPDAATVENELFGALHQFEKAAYGDDSYYISFLCTAPSARRQGLAGALIRELMERAEGEGKDVCLTTQTDDNIRYYSNFGFRVIGETSINVRGEPMRFVAMNNRQ